MAERRCATGAFAQVAHPAGGPVPAADVFVQ